MSKSPSQSKSPQASPRPTFGASIQEELRCLRVSGVAPDIPNRFVDVTIGHRQIKSSIQVDIKEHTAEAECILRCRPDAGRNGHVVENSRCGCAIQANHLVVEVGDGYTGFA